jgi:hypothetical protein
VVFFFNNKECGFIYSVKRGILQILTTLDSDWQLKAVGLFSFKKISSFLPVIDRCTGNDKSLCGFFFLFLRQSKASST